MEEISIWIKNVFVLILSVSFIEILLPDSNMSKYLRFVYSVIILACILNIFM